MKDFLILDEASFDPALGRPAKAIIAVDSIVSVQECMFTEFVDMDKEERIVGSVIAVNSGAPMIYKVRDKTQDIIQRIVSLSSDHPVDVTPEWLAMFEVKAIVYATPADAESEDGRL